MIFAQGGCAKNPIEGLYDFGYNFYLDGEQQDNTDCAIGRLFTISVVISIS
jgi:hypothetical protein